MAREYIDELGDGTINPETSGVDSQATDNGTHVKTLAPIYYTPATIDNDGKATRETPVTIKSALDGKQNTLATQTAYSAKGTATKVPQITTNSLGQVTGITEVTISGVTPASHAHGNIANGGTLTDTAAAAAGNDYVVIRDADNAKIQTSTIKGTDVADAVSKTHSHSTLTLSTTAQSYDGSHTLALPSTDPYTSARTPVSHASTATTYGIGTTSTYGHVKLATGDMNGATNTDGVAVSKNHTHSQYAPKASPALTGTPTAPTAADGTNTTQIATTAFVQSAVTQGLAVSDAMVYKGTVTLGASSPGGLTVAADKGHTYKVVANGNTKEGYVDGVKVEAGDMVICNTDSTTAATSSNYSTIAAKWDFVQGNTDGVVVGPSSAVSGNVVLFDGATGKLVKDGGTLGTAAFKSVASSGNASTTQVVMGNDTRLTDARTPASHTHGNISDGGAITSTTQSSDITIGTGDKLIVTDSSGSNKVVRTGTSFDNGVTTTYLCRNGTFATVKEADVAFGGTFKTYKSPTEAFTLQNVWFGPKPSAIVIEYSNNRTDANPTWTDYGLTDAQIGTLFSGTDFGVNVKCGKAIHVHPGYTGSATYKDLSNDNIADQGLRITVCCRNYSSRSTDSDNWVYCNLRRIFLRMSTQSATNGAHCVVESLSGANFKSNTDTWNNLGDYKIQGDTGWNSIPFGSNFGGSWDQTDRPWAVRFTIWSDTLSASPSSGHTGCMAIYSIAAISDNVWTAEGARRSMQQYGTPYVIGGDGKATFADIQFTGRKLAVSLSNTSTDTSFNGSADVTNIKVSGQLGDANIASAATWNAKQNALTINDSKPITIGTAAAANTVAGQAHTHDGITSVARASVTNIDITNPGTEPARMTLSQVTQLTTGGIDPGDGYVLNFLWDNTGNWDTQIYVPNSKKADKDFGHLKVRYKNESSTWENWEYLPGAFMGTLLTSTDDLDAITAPQKGVAGEVIQYYWKSTSKPKSTSSIGQTGMDGTTGLPSGTGSANLFVFEQSNNRTENRYLMQLMVCGDNGIWVRRQWNGTWSVWSKVLTSSDITTNTSTKNGIITVAGTDQTVYVHPVYDAAFNRANVSASADQCWAKIAEMSFDITASYAISGTWKVYCANRYAHTGILEFHSFISASSTSATFGQVELKWIGTEPISFRNYNFCMVLKAKTESSQPAIAELWCQCESSQRGISITEIGGNGWNASRMTNDRRWVYFNPADSEKTTKPVASETIQVIDPIPEVYTKSVYKEFTLPKEQISYIKINATSWHHQQMFVYSAENVSLHGEYILRSYSNGASGGTCQVISLCGGQYTENVEWYTKANERYIKFDLSSVTSDRTYRFGLTELSGGRTSDFELVSELPNDVVQITPTGPSARKLDTARELSVDLSSTSTTATSFDGTQNVSIKNTGTLPISKGGTGKTSVTAGNYLVGNGTNALAEKTPNVAANDLINALPVGDSTPGGDDYYVSQYANGDTTTTTYYRRPIKLLWEYIKTRISSVLGLTATNYGGTAATAATSADASNELQVVGVQSSATSTLKRDSGVTVQGGAVKATTFKLGTNATVTYNSTTEAIDFTFL